MNLRRTPKPTLDRDTPHVLAVEPPQCGFITVPNELVTNPAIRYVVCGRPAFAHPVTGEGRFVDHERFLPVNHDGQQ